MKFKSDIEVEAGLRDSSGALGLSGQILSSTSGNVSWVTPTVNTVARDVQNQVKAGVAINKGQAVYVTGADGTNIIVGLASNASEATSSKTLGLLNATVAANGFADVVQIGRLSGLNTIGAVAGDPVWLGTGGNLIYGLIGKPYAPANLVFIGIVTRVNASNGEIFVSVQNGFELNEIHDVDLKTTVPVNGDILGFNGTLWVNKTIAGWLGYTPANASGTVNYVSKFTGTTTLGNSLIYDDGTNVGINNTSPNYALDVIGSASISSNIYTNNVYAVSFGTVGAANSDTLINTYVGKNIVFSVNSSEKARITSTGSFGIGTVSPSQLLHVAGNARITGGIYDSANAIGTSGQVLSSTGTGTSWVTPATGTITGSGTTNYVTKFTGTSSIGNSQLFDNGTNVGIGTTTPLVKLHVVGTGESEVRVTENTNNNSIALYQQATTSYLIAGRTGATAVQPLAIYTGGSEKMRIQADGNVGIGTSAPTVSLQVGDTTSGTGSYIKVLGNNTDSTYDVFRGERRYPRFTLKDTVSGGSEFNFWNLGNQMRFGTNTGVVDTAAFVVFSGANGNSQFGGNFAFTNNASKTISINNTLTDVVGRNLTISAGATVAGTAAPNLAGGSLTLQSGLGTGTGDSSIQFQTGTTLTSGLTLQTMSTKMTILGNGNVGIGTTAPSLLLQVGSRAGIGSDGIVSWGQALTGNNRGYLSWDTDIASVNAISNLVFRTNTSSERMRITSTGDVGIGTTTPTQKLDVIGNIGMTGQFEVPDGVVFSNYTSGSLASIRTKGIDIGLSSTTANYGVIETSTTYGISLNINGATKVKVDGTTGNVGIGTSSPTQLLHVAGNARITGAVYDSSNSAGTSGQVLSSTATGTAWVAGGGGGISGSGTTNYLPKFTGSAAVGNSIMYESSGSIGIGTTTPAAKLHVAGGQILDDGAGRITFALGSAQNEIYSTTTGFAAYSDLRISASNTIFTNAGAEAMRITSVGKVGIGTTSPSSLLHLYNISFPVLTIGSGTVTANVGIDTSNNVLNVGTETYHSLKFSTNNSERMRIDPLGNVAIGATIPSAKLDVVDTMANPTVRIAYVPMSGYGGGGNIDIVGGYSDYVSGAISWKNGTTVQGQIDYNGGSRLMTLTSQYYMEFKTLSMSRMYINSMGYIGVGTTMPMYTMHVNGSVAGTSAYINLSDERYKKDILPIENALDKVLSLNGVTFNWNKEFNPDTNLDDTNHIGLIAQEVENVIPQAVFTASDDNQTKSVAYSDLVPVLIEAIKELKLEIEELKKLIDK